MSNSDFSVERIRVLQAILKAVPTSLGLGQLWALLAIAAEPGLSINDLANRINVPQQTASRYAAQLIGRYQENFSAETPISLVEQGVSADDPRSRALFLTSNGSDVVSSMVDAINKI